MRRIALVNQKGGCGKTTITINLASCLAEKGEKVLLIDLDPQGHSSLGLGFKPDSSERSLYEVLLGEVSLESAIQKLRENLDILYSDVVLSAFEQAMAGIEGREFKLSHCLKPVQNDYTYIIIDSPPSVGLLTFNGLMASSEVIIPVDPSSFSLNGLDNLLETISIIEKKVKHQLTIKILPNNIDLRTNFCRKMLEKLQEDFPLKCFHNFVNSSTALREAASLGQPIIDYDRHCRAFRDFQNLALEIITGADDTVAERTDTSKLWETEDLQKSSATKGIVFSLEAPADASVEIAGDFTNWVPESLNRSTLHGKTVWHKAFSLGPGAYAYKYVINGNWISDPANDDTVDDHRGGKNSRIRV
jgi:chromosome partitioning protein